MKYLNQRKSEKKFLSHYLRYKEKNKKKIAELIQFFVNGITAGKSNNKEVIKHIIKENPKFAKNILDFVLLL